MAARKLTRTDMEADLAELVHLLESAHPDPYAAGGGRVAFHRRADAIRRGLPQEGLTELGFLRRLRPLVAAVGDGHTSIRQANPAADGGPRLWLDWDVVETCLYVATVYREQDRPLLGRRLRAVGGVPFADLVGRVRELLGIDNPFHNLTRLARALASPTLLAELLKVDSQPSQVRIDVEDGPPTVLPVVAEAPGDPLQPPSALDLPSLDASDIGWGLLGDAALLRIESMSSYREVFEYARARGPGHYLGQPLTAVATAALGGTEPPADLAARIAAVPSATETLRDLFGAMRQRGTHTLIVDLRRNTGGNSLLSLMLAYFLWGAEPLVDLDDGYQIPRYSALYRLNYPDAPQPDGYDFSEEIAWRAGPRAQPQVLAEYIAGSATFAREFAAKTWVAAWTPRVIAVTSAFTYSAGFDCARILHRLGAGLLGVASAQAGNCFIDALQYTLPRSGLCGSIAYKQSLMYPDDPDLGRVLRPGRELTYRDLQAMGFDPNAALRLALQPAP